MCVAMIGSLTISGNDDGGLVTLSARPDADGDADADGADTTNDDGDEDADSHGSGIIDCLVVVLEGLVDFLLVLLANCDLGRRLLDGGLWLRDAWNSPDAWTEGLTSFVVEGQWRQSQIWGYFLAAVGISAARVRIEGVVEGNIDGVLVSAGGLDLDALLLYGVEVVAFLVFDRGVDRFVNVGLVRLFRRRQAGASIVCVLFPAVEFTFNSGIGFSHVDQADHQDSYHGDELHLRWFYFIF